MLEIIKEYITETDIIPEADVRELWEIEIFPLAHKAGLVFRFTGYSFDNQAEAVRAVRKGLENRDQNYEVNLMHHIEIEGGEYSKEITQAHLEFDPSLRFALGVPAFRRLQSLEIEPNLVGVWREERQIPDIFKQPGG